MKMFTRLFLFSLLGLAAVNCAERGTYTFTINPDGSGKIDIDIKKALVKLGQKASDKEATVQQVSKIVNEAKGIKAWGKLKYKYIGNSEYTVKATAYFDRLDEVSFDGLTTLRWQWQKQGKGGLLTLHAKSRENPMKKKSGPEQSKEQSREQWKQMRPMVEMMMQKSDIRIVFILPGKISSLKTMKKVKKGVGLHIKGKNLYAAIDKAMMTDAKDEDVQMMMFGSKDNEVSAKVKGAKKAKFNYKKEVKKALKGQKKLLKGLTK